MIDAIYAFGLGLLGTTLWPVVWNLIKIVLVVLPLMGCVAYLTLWERKAIGWMQIRIGPNRVGPLGLLQPIADALKLLTKEIIVPAAANKGLFFLGPIMTIMPALAAWVVIPFGPEVALAMRGIPSSSQIKAPPVAFAMGASFSDVARISVASLASALPIAAAACRGP